MKKTTRSTGEGLSVKCSGAMRAVCIILLFGYFGKAEAAEVVNIFTSGAPNFNAAGVWDPGTPGPADDVTVSGLTAAATLQLNTSALSLGSFTYATSAGNLVLIGYNADRVLDVAGAITVDGGTSRFMTLRDGNAKLNVNAGSIVINRGTLQLGSTTAGLNALTAGSTTVGADTLLQVRQITTSANFGNTTVSGTAHLTATPLQNVHNQISFGALTGNGTVKVRDSGSNVNHATLTLGGSTGTSTFSGTITDADNADDRLNLVKTGAGTQVLSGNNSYRGTTTVSEGVLLITGDSSALTGGFTIEAGAALGGNGTVGGNIVFADGAKFFFDPAATLMTENGSSVDLGNLSVASLIGLDGSAATQTYTLIDGTATFDFTNVQNLGVANAFDLGGGKSAYFEEGSLNLVVIPEPATVGLFFISGIVLFIGRFLTEK